VAFLFPRVPFSAFLVFVFVAMLSNLRDEFQRVVSWWCVLPR
jgi:hypothetical protein